MMCVTVIYIIKIINFCVRVCLCACARVRTCAMRFLCYTYIKWYVCNYNFYIVIFRSLQFCYPKYWYILSSILFIIIYALYVTFLALDYSLFMTCCILYAQEIKIVSKLCSGKHNAWQMIINEKLVLNVLWIPRRAQRFTLYVADGCWIKHLFSRWTRSC